MKTPKYTREIDPKTIAKREGKSVQWVYQNLQPPLEPTFDADGYSTEETLEIVRKWKIASNFAIRDLLAYVEKAWRYPFRIRRGGRGRKRWIYIATHGWSGNEELVGALQDNAIFWALCWLESHRGGGFKFLTAPIAESCEK